MLAIDPGTTESGWVVFEGGAVIAAGVSPNPDILDRIAAHPYDQLAVEMIASYGMAVGREVFRTVWWTGRIAQAWMQRTGRLPIEVYRQDVKLHLCGTSRAKDGNIRQALIDLLGPRGTKRNPGPTYGVKSHAWAALAVAVTAAGLRPAQARAA